jgi:hypothetical protein
VSQVELQQVQQVEEILEQVELQQVQAPESERQVPGQAWRVLEVAQMERLLG